MEVSAHSHDVHDEGEIVHNQVSGHSLRKKTRAPEPEPQNGDAATNGWTLEPHVCCSCFGRLASRPDRFNQTRYLCTNCGVQALGDHARALCACGMRIRRAQGIGELVDAGLRCQKNPSPTPEFPSEYVAFESAN